MMKSGIFKSFLRQSKSASFLKIIAPIAIYSAWYLRFAVCVVELNVDEELDGDRDCCAEEFEKRSGGSAKVRRSIRLRNAVKMCPSFHRRYWPTVYAPTALLQIGLMGFRDAAILFRKVALGWSPYHAKELLSLSDGEVISLHWLFSRQEEDQDMKRPVIVLLHGAFQGAHSAPMIGLAQALSKAGFSAVVMNRRGYEMPNTKGKHSMFGFDRDLDDVLTNSVAARYPGRPVSIIGFSCGATYACRYIANCERRSSNQNASVNSDDNHIENEMQLEDVRNAASALYMKARAFELLKHSPVEAIIPCQNEDRIREEVDEIDCERVDNSMCDEGDAVAGDEAWEEGSLLDEPHAVQTKQKHKKDKARAKQALKLERGHEKSEGAVHVAEEVAQLKEAAQAESPKTTRRLTRLRPRQTKPRPKGGNRKSPIQESENTTENAARLEAENAAKEAARLEAENAAKEAARLEAENAAKEAARLEAENAAKEAARLEAENAAKEAARLEAENAAKEAARLEAENAAKEEARLEAENAAKEAARLGDGGQERHRHPEVLCGAALDYGFDTSDGGAIRRLQFPYREAVGLLIRFQYLWGRQKIHAAPQERRISFERQLVDEEGGFAVTSYRLARRSSKSFTDDDDWHDESQACIANVKVPLLIVRSRDDPVLRFENGYGFQHEIDGNSNLLTAVLKRGSHGTKAGIFGRGDFAVRMIVEFVEAMHASSSSSSFSSLEK